MKTKFPISIILISILFTIANCSKDVNEPPTCKIITPTEGYVVLQGDSVFITVETNDDDGIITQVQFFIDGIGKDAVDAFPYNYIWGTGNDSIGPHVLKAVSLDNEGGRTSDEITIIITDGLNDPNDPSYSEDIQPFFDAKCIACHNGTGIPLDLTSPDSYFNLIDDPNYIDIDNPENSELYTKIIPGGSMEQYANSAERLLTLYWIEQGAKDN
jgi:hypothetical protein